MSYSPNRERICIPELDQMLGAEIPVLDKGFVRLIEYMGNDNMVASSARISYGVNEKSQNNRALLRFLMKHKHWSPFEMCEICFHVKVPIFIAAQWLRHRTGNFNQISARYTEIPEECYIPWPQDVRGQSKTNKQVGDAQLPDENVSKFIDLANDVEKFSFDKYHEAIDLGVAKEIARGFLPNSFYTQLYYKTDLRNLFNFLSLRTSSGAQHEIKVYAKAIIEIVKKWVPICWEAFEDYHINAKSISKPESKLLKGMLDPKMAKEFLDKEFSEEELKGLNMSGREVDEFKSNIKNILGEQ